MPARIIIDDNRTGFYLHRLPGRQRALLARYAGELVEKMQETIDKEGYGTWPPLAESTIKSKGFDDMLVETGQLYNSIQIFPGAADELGVNAFFVGWPSTPKGPDSRGREAPEWMTLDVLAAMHELGVYRPRRPVVETTYVVHGAWLLSRLGLEIIYTFETAKSSLMYGGAGKGSMGLSRHDPLMRGGSTARGQFSRSMGREMRLSTPSRTDTTRLQRAAKNVRSGQKNVRSLKLSKKAPQRGKSIVERKAALKSLGEVMKKQRAQQKALDKSLRARQQGQADAAAKAKARQVRQAELLRAKREQERSLRKMYGLGKKPKAPKPSEKDSAAFYKKFKSTGGEDYNTLSGDKERKFRKK